MNVEIRTEVSQFPEKEYINGIFVTVRSCTDLKQRVRTLSPSTSTTSLMSFLLTNNRDI